MAGDNLRPRVVHRSHVWHLVLPQMLPPQLLPQVPHCTQSIAQIPLGRPTKRKQPLVSNPDVRTPLSLQPVDHQDYAS
jgi:hypothetical protein